MPRSGVPYSRQTSLAKRFVWKVMEYAMGDANDICDVIIGSHVHYHEFGGEPGILWLTTPALQISSDFGEKKVDGLIHTGVTYFDIDDEGGYTWNVKLYHQKGRFSNKREMY